MGPTLLNVSCGMGPMSSLSTKVILWISPEMGCILRNVMHESFVHVLCTYVFFSFLYIFGLVCFASVFLLIGSCLFVQMSITPYVSFMDGASHSTRNLSSLAWVIYDPSGELIELQGICLGWTTKNVIEYSVVLELLTKAINISICALLVNLDS